MKPEITNKVDADKISETLEVKWQHEVIQDDCFEKPEIITLENTCLFKLIESDSLKISLYVLNDVPNEVTVFLAYRDSSTSIRFQNITKVLYNPKLNIIIFESKNAESYSQLRIGSGGQFDLSVSNPISNYKNSWLTFMGENLGLIEFKPE